MTEFASASHHNNIQLYSVIPSNSDGESIKAKLADRFKDGLLILDDGDLQNYVICFLVACVFFAFNGMFWWKIMSYLKVQQFVQRGHEDKIFFLQ